MKKILFCILILLFSLQSYARNISVPEDVYNSIYDQLRKDEAALIKDDKKWEAIRSKDTVPKIEYTVQDDKLVVEKITVPVSDDNPLVFINNFEVIMKNSAEGFFPLKLRLWAGGVRHKQAATLSTSSKTIFSADARLGIKLIGLSPIPIKYFNGFGLNALVGLQGFGCSLSWDLPFKVLSSTSIHLGYGFTYKLIPQYSLGVSLNF